VKKWIITILSLCCFCGDGFAVGKTMDPPLIQIGGGVFDIIRQDRRHAQAQIEYKWSPIVYKLRPFIGLMGTGKEAAYVYGGIGLDLFIGKHFVITPSFAPGIYFQGQDKNLGYPLEFRSSVEAAAVFSGQYRLGLQFYHISNASLGHRNPGVECLVLFLAIPLNH